VIKAIIIPVYKRVESLKRLITSLLSSNITENTDLVFSLDNGYSTNIYNYIKTVQWRYGDKKIILNKYKKGVDGNNIHCFKLGQYYDYFILLEDDCIVHPQFMDFTDDIINFYSSQNDLLSGFSLYRYEKNEILQLPHLVPFNGNFTFFLQKVSSRGSFYSKEQSINFLNYLKLNQFRSKIPKSIAKWGADNWEVIFTHYMVEYNKYIVFPRKSFSLPFGERGVHIKKSSDYLTFRSELIWIYNKKINFENFHKTLLKYDAFYNICPDFFNDQKSFENYQEYLISKNYEIIPKELNFLNPYSNFSVKNSKKKRFLNSQRDILFMSTYNISYIELIRIFFKKILVNLKTITA